VPEKTTDKPERRSVEDIQADLEQTRQRLAANIAQLKEEIKPEALKAKAKAAVMSVAVDPQTGQVRVERVAMAAGVVVGLIVITKGLRSRAHKRHMRRLGEVVWVPVPRGSVRPELIPVSRDAAELAPSPAAITAG